MAKMQGGKSMGMTKAPTPKTKGQGMMSGKMPHAPPCNGPAPKGGKGK